MGFLDIINSVLRRLREEQVASINESEYSTLIGDFVNASKREIENSWDWSALRNTLTVETTDGLFNWILTNAGTRFKVIDVYNATTPNWMELRSTEWMDKNFGMVGTVARGAPAYYAFNGVTSTGDAQVDVYPIPDGVYTLRFNIVQRQYDLVEPTDKPLIPYQLIIEGTTARAIAERGEDGGSNSQEVRFKNLLSDYISLEAARKPSETIWSAV
tara:strand:+ start:645 stop:1289 length:645 start_codon:yes stop_codon:yes gene_type:complete